METIDKVKRINEILKKGEPNNISVDTYSGYTGYTPQSVIDAVNTEFLGKWSPKIIEKSFKVHKDSMLAIVHLSLEIEGFMQVESFGQSRVTKGDFGDALKGAETDAIKKAFAMFSIGNRAYHGLLEVKK